MKSCEKEQIVADGEGDQLWQENGFGGPLANPLSSLSPPASLVVERGPRPISRADGNGIHTQAVLFKNVPEETDPNGRDELSSREIANICTEKEARASTVGEKHECNDTSTSLRQGEVVDSEFNRIGMGSGAIAEEERVLLCNKELLSNTGTACMSMGDKTFDTETEEHISVADDFSNKSKWGKRVGTKPMETAKNNEKGNETIRLKKKALQSKKDVSTSEENDSWTKGKRTQTEYEEENQLRKLDMPLSAKNSWITHKQSCDNGEGLEGVAFEQQEPQQLLQTNRRDSERLLETGPMTTNPRSQSEQHVRPGVFFVQGMNWSDQLHEQNNMDVEEHEDLGPFDAIVTAELPLEMQTAVPVSSVRESGGSFSASLPSPQKLAVVPTLAVNTLKSLLRTRRLLRRSDELDRIKKPLLGMNTEKVANNQAFEPCEMGNCATITKFMTIVQGMGGAGKTTLAAMAVSCKDVRTHFSDGIAWTKLGELRAGNHLHVVEDISKPSLSHSEYLYHLHKILSQLNIAAPDFEDVVFLPSDDKAARERKEQQGMYKAQKDMSNILKGRKILVVIDDAWNASDIELFNFSHGLGSTLQLLVTTRLNLFQMWHERQPASFMQEFVIKVGKLTENEAVELLWKESHSEFCKAEFFTKWREENEGHILSIIKSCDFLPVAVRNIGKIMATWRAKGNLKQPDSIKQLALELKEGSEWRSSGKNHNLRSHREYGAELFDLFDKSFSSYLHGEELAQTLRLSFCVFALVFCKSQTKRPWVPSKVANKLLDNIISTHNQSFVNNRLEALSLKKLFEKLEALGLVDSEQDTSERGDESYVSAEALKYRVHHDLLVEYSQYQWDQKGTLSWGDSKIHPQGGGGEGRGNTPAKLRWRARLGCGPPPKEESEPEQNSLHDYHRLFVEEYQRQREKRPDLSWDVVIADDGYVYEHLPYHMIKSCNENMHFKMLRLICDEGFLRGRMASLGVRGATAALIKDVEALGHYNCDFRKESSKDWKERKLSIFNAIQLFLKTQLSVAEPSSVREVGEAFVLTAKALQRQNLWLSALDTFSEVVCFLKSAGMDENHPFFIQVLRHANATAIPKLVLVPRGSTKSLKLKHAKKICKCRKQKVDGDEKPTRREAVSLELSSHPGQAIVLMRPTSDPVQVFKANFHQLGIGPKDSALHMCAWGDNIYDPSCDCILMTFQGSYKGDGIGLVPYSDFVKPGWPGCVSHFGFEINEDGTISSTQNPDCVVGIGLYPLVLVARNSPNRFILKYGKNLREGKTLSKVGHFPSQQRGLPLELSSHPGFGITVQFSSPLNLGAYRYNALGMDTAEDAIQASYDGRIISKAEDGSVFSLLLNKVNKVGSPVMLWRANSRSMTCWKGAINDFVINKEGSISPMHLPNMALGCPCLGHAKNVITVEDQAFADKQSLLKAKDITLSRHSPRRVMLLISFLFNFRVSKLKVKDM